MLGLTGRQLSNEKILKAPEALSRFTRITNNDAKTEETAESLREISYKRRCAAVVRNLIEN